MEKAYSIIERLKEPSSWAGFAAVLGVVGINIAPATWDATVAAGTAVAGLIAILVPESGAKS